MTTPNPDSQTSLNPQDSALIGLDLSLPNADQSSAAQLAPPLLAEEPAIAPLSATPLSDDIIPAAKLTSASPDLAAAPAGDGMDSLLGQEAGVGVTASAINEVSVVDHVLVFEDDLAQANDLSLSIVGGSLVLQDSANAIAAGTGVTAVSANQVSVALDALVGIEIDGGDAADTFNFASNLLLPGIDLMVDAETITLADGVVLATRQVAGADWLSGASTGDSGAIQFTGETITIGDNAQILAHADGGFQAGDIILTASKTSIIELENLSPVNIQTQTATLDVGAGARLHGNNLILRSQASDVTFTSQLGASSLVNNFVIQPLLDRVADLAALPVKVLKKASEAFVTVGENAQLLGSGGVSINAVANADSTGQAQSSLFSVGYSEANATATVDIGTGANINAGEAVVISSEGDATASISTETDRDLDAPFNPLQTALSLGVAQSNIVSHVVVPTGVTVTAGKTVNIQATGNSDTETEAEAGLYADGRAGIALGLGFSDADIKSEVNGVITANQNSGAVVKIEFDPTRPGAIDFENNRINLAIALNNADALSDDTTIPHALSTGDKLNYSNRRGTSIGGIGIGQITGGLVDGQDYYVVVDPTDPDFIYLAESRKKALAAEEKLRKGEPLNFDVFDIAARDAIALSEGAALNTRSFDPAMEIDDEQNTITIQNPPFTGGTITDFSIFGSTFELGQAVVYNSNGGNAIGGLEDGQVYYVITSTGENNLAGDNRLVDEQVIQLAETENKARAGIALDIDPTLATGGDHSFSALHVLDSGLATGIGVLAELESSDQVSTTAGLESEDMDEDDDDTDDAFTDILTTPIAESIFSAFSQDYSANADAGGSGASSSLSLAAAFSFSDADHRVLAIVGDIQDDQGFDAAFDTIEDQTTASTAVLKSREDLEVTATITEQLQLSAESSTEPQEGNEEAAENSFSAAVIVGLQNNQAKAIVQEDAQLDAFRATRVISDVSYPFLTRPDEFIPGTAGELIDSLKANGPDAVLGYLNGNLGLDSLLNTWARSTAESSELAVAGSVNFLDFNNVSKAIVKSGAQINQDEDFRSGDGNESVSVEATNYMQVLNLTGVFDFALPDLNDDLLQLDLDLTGSDSGRGGIGGAFFLKFLDNATHAIVEDDVSIFSGELGGFNMKAEEAVLHFSFSQAGASAGQYAIAGTFAYVEQNSDTLALLSSGVNVTGESVTIYAGSLETQINWAGGVASGESIGVGATVAINDIERNTTAAIGHLETDQPADGTDAVPANPTNIDVNGDIRVNALNDGNLWAFSLAAAIASPSTSTPEQDSALSDDPLDGQSLPALFGEEPVSNDQGNQGRSGIGISGDVSINTVTDNVRAYVYDAGLIHGNQFDLVSLNETDLVSASGAAAFVRPQGNNTSVGIAGSFSKNELQGQTDAFFQGKDGLTGQPSEQPLAAPLNLEAVDLTITADRRGQMIAVSAGGAAAPNRQGIAVAGSVSLNSITNQTEARLEHAAVNLLGGLAVTAEDESTIYAIGGAASLGGRAGFGAAIALNQITSGATNALILDADLSYLGDLTVTAENNAEIQSLTASLGLSTSQQGIGVSGTVSLNLIDSDATAAVIDSRHQAGQAPGAITIQATDDSLIRSLSGAVGIGGNAGIGAAIAYNAIDNNTTASVDGSSLATSASLTVQADASATIETLSAGVAGGNDVGLAGSASINIINSTATAQIENGSDVAALGAVNLGASDRSSIVSIAGAIGGGQTAAVGAAVAVNEIGNPDDPNRGVIAAIENSTVDAGQDIGLDAQFNAKIVSIAVGGSGAGDFALGGGVSLNTVGQTVKAAIANNASVTAGGDLSLTASDLRNADELNGGLEAYLAENSDNSQATSDFLQNVEDATIFSVSGGIAGAQTAAIGAAVSTNDVRNTLITTIDQSTVVAQDVDLQTVSSSVIQTITAGGAGAGDFALGGSISLNEIASSLTASVTSGASVTATGAVELTVNDAATIESLAGVVVGGGRGAVGAAFSTNDIGNTLLATVDSATVVGSEVSLDASTTSEIQAIAAGGAVAGNAAVGGSITLNEIDNSVQASLANGAVVTATGDLSVTASDDSTLQSLAGQVAVAVSSAAVSVGAAIATNDIGNQVSATLDGATVSAASATVAARSEATIETLSAGVSVSGGKFTGAVSGAISLNDISNTIEASVRNGSQVNTSGNLAIAAEDTSTLRSLSGQVAAAISLGAGLGAAVAYNRIGNTVTAFAEDATLSSYIAEGTWAIAGGNIAITADSTNTIETIAAGAAASGIVGVGGSVAINEMTSMTAAYGDNSGLMAYGSIAILADTRNTITTYGGTIGGGAIGVAGSVVVNNLDNTTAANLRDTQATALGHEALMVPRADGSGDLESLRGLGVIATSQSDIDVLAGAVALSAGGSLGGTVVVNSITDTTQSAIAGGAVNPTILDAHPDQDVVVNAFNDTDVSVGAGTLSASIGIGTIGVSIDVTTVNTATTANIDGAVVNAVRHVDVTAIGDQTVNSTVAAGSLTASPLGGLAVAGSVSVVNIGSAVSMQGAEAAADTGDLLTTQLDGVDAMTDSAATNRDLLSDLNESTAVDEVTVQAAIGADAQITAGGDILVVAEETTTLNALSGAAAVSTGISLGGAVAITNVETHVQATVGDGVSLAAGDDVVVTADQTANLSGEAYAGQAGLVGLGAQVVILENASNQTATIGNGVVITEAGNADATDDHSGVVVTATANQQANAQSIGGAIAGVAAGVSIARATSTGNTTATIGTNASIGQSGEPVGGVTVEAIANVDTNAKAIAVAGGLISGVGADADAIATPNVTAAVGAGTDLAVAGDVTVGTRSDATATANGDGVALGGVALGVTFADATTGGTSTAHLDGTVTTADNVSILGNANHLATATTRAAAGGLISGQGTVANATASPTTQAYLGDDAGVTAANAVTIMAQSNTDADANADASGIGIANIGVAEAIATLTPTVETYVGEGATITAGGNVTIASQQGDRVVVSDGTFGADTVNSGSNTIQLEGRHGLNDGDQVIYSQGDNPAIGGLESDRSYNVLAVDDTTVQLGNEFAPAQVNLGNDTITFNRPHNFETGDRVIYEADGGSIAGLVPGQTYFVRVIDSNTIKLSTTLAEAEGNGLQGFNAALIDGAEDIIRDPSHGFTTGQAVTYRAPVVPSFTAAQVNSGTNVIDFGTDADGIPIEHGLVTGQAVTYRTSSDISVDEDASANLTLGGLLPGQTYYVIRLDATRFQLAATREATGIDDEDDTNPIDLDATNVVGSHSLRPIAIGGLVDGQTYYVINVEDDTGVVGFQLATSQAAASGGDALNLNTTSISGNHLFGVEGVDFRSSGTADEQRLVLDLGAASGDRHQLIGAGGAVGLTGEPSGDGIATAVATGLSGSVVGGLASTASVDATANVATYVDDGATITAGQDVDVTSTSFSNGASTSTNRRGGAISAGAANANTNVDNINRTYTGSDVMIQAGQDVALITETGQIGSSNTTARGYAGVDISRTDVDTTIDYQSTAEIGQGTQIIATDGITLDATSRTSGTATADLDSRGLGSDAESSADVIVGDTQARTSSTVGGDADLRADQISITANSADLSINAFADTDTNAAGADADARATARVADTTEVDLHTGAELSATDSVNLTAQQGQFASRSTARSQLEIGTINFGLFRVRIPSIGGDTDAIANNQQTVNLAVSAADGSHIKTDDLTVAVDGGTVDANTNASRRGAVFDGGSRNPNSSGTHSRTIDFNATLSAEVDPELVIDADGNVVRAYNATIADSDGVTLGPVQREEIVVNDLRNDAQLNATFRISQDSFSNREDGDSDDSVTLANQLSGNPEFQENYDDVTITNYSDKDIVINNIDVINETVPVITVDAPNTSFGGEFTTLPVILNRQLTPTQVEIKNLIADTPSEADIRLNGTIFNPHGVTQIDNDAGDILADRPEAIIETRSLALEADQGQIGTADARINGRLVQGFRGDSSLEADFTASAEGAVYLELTGDRQNTAPLAITSELLESHTDDVNLLIRQSEDAAGNPVPASYEFEAIRAGGDIILNAEGDTNLTGNTDLLGDGKLETLSGGNIDLTEVNGPLTVRRAESTGGDVSLTVTDSQATGEDLVLGSDATIRAAQGDVNLQVGDDVEMAMESQIEAGGTVAIATDSDSDAEGSDVILRGSLQADTVTITTGDDADGVTVSEATYDGVTVNLGDGHDVFNGGDGVDRVNAGDGDDRISGNGGADILSGGAGNDVLSGNDGDDQIAGDAGDDVLDGGVGNDQIAGGDGGDTLTGGDGDDTLDGEAGDDTINGGDGEDQIQGGSGNDTLSGDGDADQIRGGDGDDLLSGGDDDDTLDGEAGQDDLSGDDGNDTLNGGPDDDLLLGGNGDDQLTGGTGFDFLEGGTGTDTFTPDAEDIIADPE